MNNNYKLLKDYGTGNQDLNNRFQFRDILVSETDQAVRIEEICFPAP